MIELNNEEKVVHENPLPVQKEVMISEFREKSREKSLNELKAYREALLSSMTNTEFDTSSQKGKSKKLGAHPQTSTFYRGENSIESEDPRETKWVTNGGFVSALFLSFITMFMSIFFFTLSYLFYN